MLLLLWWLLVFSYEVAPTHSNCEHRCSGSSGIKSAHKMSKRDRPWTMTIRPWIDHDSTDHEAFVTNVHFPTQNNIPPLGKSVTHHSRKQWSADGFSKGKPCGKNVCEDALSNVTLMSMNRSWCKWFGAINYQSALSWLCSSCVSPWPGRDLWRRAGCTRLLGFLRPSLNRCYIEDCLVVCTQEEVR